MSQKLKNCVNFASWQCAGRYIPSKYKCWADEKGNKLKTSQTFQQYRRKQADTYKAAQKGKNPQAEYEKKLLDSVRDHQSKIERKKNRAKLSAATKSVGARKILSNGIAEAEVDKLNVDSKDGKTYVVNSHNRADLAKKLGVEKAEFEKSYVRRSKTGKLHRVRSRRKKVINGVITGGALLGIGGLALTAKGRPYKPNLGSTTSNILPTLNLDPVPTVKEVLEETARKNLNEIDNFLKDPRNNSLTFSRLPRLAQFNESGTYKRRTKIGKTAIVRKGR